MHTVMHLPAQHSAAHLGPASSDRQASKGLCRSTLSFSMRLRPSRMSAYRQVLLLAFLPCTDKQTDTQTSTVR